MEVSSFAKLFDHSIVRPDATARRFGSTRTEHFVGAFQALAAETRTRFARACCAL